jgi:hypothetical protein
MSNLLSKFLPYAELMILTNYKYDSSYNLLLLKIIK